MKKLSKEERRKRISEGLRAAWKRRKSERKFAPVVISGHHRVAAVQSLNGCSFSQVAASALAFIKAAGGLENAKATMDMIQQVREVL